MLPIQNLYTGREVDVSIPDLGKTEAAVARAQQSQQRLYETKYNDALRRHQEALKAGDIDVVDLITEKNVKDQADMIEEFQDKFIKKYTERGDKGLSTEDLLEIQKEAKRVEGKQKKMKDSEEKFLKDELLFRSKRGTYDPNSWEQATAKMYETGEYDGEGLQLRSVDTRGEFLKYAASKASSIGKVTERVETPIDGGGTHIAFNEKWNFNENDPTDVEALKKDVNAFVLSKEEYEVTEGREFLALPPQEQQRYHDEASADPLIDNGVVMYAYDKFKDDLMRDIKKGRTQKEGGATAPRRDAKGTYYVNNKPVAQPGDVTGSVLGLNGERGIVITDYQNNKQDINASGVIATEPGVDLSGVSGIKGYPKVITSNEVEWVIDNNNKIPKWVIDDSGNRVAESLSKEQVTAYKQKGMFAQQVDNPNIDSSSMDISSMFKDVFSGVGEMRKDYYIFTIPKTINVKTGRIDYHQQIKFYAGDEYEKVFGWDDNVKINEKPRKSFNSVIK